MTKYFIQDETLTNLADKIRVLNGTEDTMTPSQMDSELDDANDEVDAQSALIDQLSEMLDGKASGGDSSSGADVETYTFTISCSSETIDRYPLYIIYTTLINSVAESRLATLTNNGDIEIQVIKGTSVVLFRDNSISVNDVTDTNLNGDDIYDIGFYHHVTLVRLIQDNRYVVFESL